MMTQQLSLFSKLKVHIKRVAGALGYLNSEERACNTEVDQAWQSRMEGRCAAIVHGIMCQIGKDHHFCNLLITSVTY